MVILICLIPSQLSYHLWIPVLDYPRSDYLSLTVYATDILAILLVLVRLHGHRLKLIDRLKTVFTSRSGLFILGAILVNTTFSLYPALSLFKYLKILIYIGLLSEYSWSSEKMQRLFIKSLVVLILWVSSLAIIQFLNKSSVGGLLYWLGERPLTLGIPSVASINLNNFGQWLRSYSTFPHPNALAGFIVATLPLLFYYKKLCKSTGISKIINVSILLAVLSLVSSFSFSAIFVFLCYLVFSPKSQTLDIKHKLIISSIILVLTLFISYLVRPVSILDRYEQLGSAGDIFVSSPVTGTGLGAYLLGSKSPISPYGTFYQPVHNIYLLFLTETGILGLLVLTTLLIRIKKPSKSQMANSILLSIFSIAALGTIDHYWLTSHSNLVFAVLLLVIYFKQNDNTKIIK